MAKYDELDKEEKRYQSYEKWVDYFKSKGYDIYKYNRAEYLTVYSGETEENRKRGEPNKSVARDIASKQAYGVSVRQGRATAKMAQNFLEEIHAPYVEEIIMNAPPEVSIDKNALNRYVKRGLKKRHDEIAADLKEKGYGDITSLDYDYIRSLTKTGGIRQGGKAAVEFMADVLDLKNIYYQKKAEFRAAGADVRQANMLARKYISHEFFGSPL